MQWLRFDLSSKKGGILVSNCVDEWLLRCSNSLPLLLRWMISTNIQCFHSFQYADFVNFKSWKSQKQQLGVVYSYSFYQLFYLFKTWR